MNFVIELYGDAKGCAVVPTISRAMSSRKGDNTCIDMMAITNEGFDGFLRVNCGSDINIVKIASGMENSVQVELPYPWSNHGIMSNVPVESFCKNGYFDSIIHLIKVKISKVIAKLKAN
tara:strand:+ start:118 stop:474 length:357 start_codon:yes stop_codon:yes gene_type:complete